MYYVTISSPAVPSITYTLLDPATTYAFPAFSTNFPSLADPSIDIVYTVCTNSGGGALSALQASFFVTNPVTSPALII